MARVAKPKVARKVSVTKSKVAGFLSFGPNNDFPQTLLDVIDDSDTASAAMSVRAEFIEGNGFYDLSLSEMIVNRKGETLDDILNQTARNLAEGEVIVLHWSYNGLGQKVGLQVIPWEQIRFKMPDDLGNITKAGIFPYIGSTLYNKRQNENKEVFLYNPDPAVVLAQIEASGGIEQYYGQLQYVPIGGKKGQIYHIPSYAGGSSEFETEAELSKYRYRLVTSDLVTPGFIKGLAPGKTKIENERDTDSLANRVQQHQGAENAGSVFVIEAATQAELDSIKFEPMVMGDLATRYSAMSEEVEAHISRRTRVPNELMGIRKSSSGISFTQIQIKLFSQLMQQTVNRYQRSVERVFSAGFADWHVPVLNRDFGIENLNYFPNDATNGDSTSVAQPG
ncbi:hypothetical protein [Spirosoma luteum]|uniref:hypothetical protein n=1 Tax=Spirosoma luteum TaxID=431553 RepID=UPI00037DE162|nr:hypothetical protein [Spirosoma luteum]